MSTPTAPVIALEQVTKTFGSFQALNNLSLTVTAGEVHGFLGPNGAGKSTTMRLLLGFIKASSGRAEIFGQDVWTEAPAIHRRLAYVPGDVDLWPMLTGGEAIDLLARLRGTLNRRRRDELIERFDLDPTRKARTYSKGNRQKVALISALASEAELYLLDEPTSGLDPLKEAEFQAVIREVTDEGGTVLLSSHILSEVEALADRISIIRDGAIVESGTLEQLRHMTRTSFMIAVADDAADALSRIRSQAGVVEVTQDEAGRVHFDVEHDRVADVLPLLAELGITDLTAQPPSLEHILMGFYRQEVDAS